jgi:hypothetical protein
VSKSLPRSSVITALSATGPSAPRAGDPTAHMDAAVPARAAPSQACRIAGPLGTGRIHNCGEAILDGSDFDRAWRIAKALRAGKQIKCAGSQRTYLYISTKEPLRPSYDRSTCWTVYLGPSNQLSLFASFYTQEVANAVH